MTDSRILPGARERLINPDGTTKPEFYRFFRLLQESGVSADQIRALCIKLGSPDGTIANIPDNQGGIQSIIGQAPIVASGNTVSLAPLAQTVGGPLVGVTVDGFGRVSQTRPVVAGSGITIDDTTDPDQIELIASGLTNPMTTLGDIITGDTGGAPKRLPIGTSGQVLTVVSGEPAWAAGGGGSLDVQDEGSTVVTGATAINFVGAGVTATAAGSVATVTIPGGGSDPWTYVRLSSDYNMSSTTPATVTGMSIAQVANTTLIVQGVFLLRSSATATGPRIGIAWPSTSNDGVARIGVQSGTTAGQEAFGTYPTNFASQKTSVASTTISEFCTIDVSLVCGASPSGNLDVTLQSETAATQVTARAGSWIRYRTIN